VQKAQSVFLAGLNLLLLKEPFWCFGSPWRFSQMAHRARLLPNPARAQCARRRPAGAGLKKISSARGTSNALLVIHAQGVKNANTQGLPHDF